MSKFQCVDGVFQKFTTLPLDRDAIYFHRPGKTGLVYVDWQFQHRPDVQALFRRALIDELIRLQNKSQWSLLSPLLYFSTSLERLGIVLKEPKALPPGLENPFIGFSQDDTPFVYQDYIVRGS